MEWIYDCRNLNEVREQIDRLDRAIVSLIAERGVYVQQAAGFKPGAEPEEDGKRIDQVMRRVGRLAGELGADAALTAKIYRTMIGHFVESERRQRLQQQEGVVS
ncbi:chorismate mutase [Vogesella sp. LIG4]|uniref:chorismate mutase n=1 Tax=Vogesella sp. LIG4 TaxID=1192162 RepID=UPI00081FFEC2|nr:chorismate mutase [Vogesella sp. LIG4]SCK06606.1 isochorismate pyruvate lyase [Vogesella sp. LIG4]